MKRTKLDDRVLPVYTKGEEIFNMVTHIVGGAMGIAALVLCIIFCHDGYGLFSGIVYGISMILLYIMSAIRVLPIQVIRILLFPMGDVVLQILVGRNKNNGI